MLDVAVRLRRFIVKQGFVGADDVAAEGIAHQFCRAVFRRQPRLARAALPFAPGTVREAGKVARIQPGRADEIAVAAARTGDDHQTAIGRRRAFAVQPAVAVRDKLIVDAVADEVVRAAELLREAGGDEGAVGGCVGAGGVVRGKVGGCLTAVCGEWLVAVALDVRAQNTAAVAA